MPIIKIQPDSVRQQGSRLSQAASDLTALHWEINRLANQLDWEVRGKGHVEAKISEAATLGKKLYEEAQRLSEYLKTCAAVLEDADSQGQQGISATMSTASLSTGLVVGSSAVGAGVLAGVIAGSKSPMSTTTDLKWHKKCISTSKTFEEKMEELKKLREEDTRERRETLDEIKKAISREYGQVSKSGGECNGFASEVFKRMYGVDIGHKQFYTMNGEDVVYTRSEFYRLDVSIKDGVREVGQVLSGGAVTEGQVGDLFAGAKIGDFVQMKWTTSGTPHSAIFNGIVDGKISFYDANMDLHNGIKTHEYTYAEFASLISKKGNGVSIYTSALPFIPTESGLMK